MQQAVTAIPPELRAELHEMAAEIRTFHSKLGGTYMDVANRLAEAGVPGAYVIAEDLETTYEGGNDGCVDVLLTTVEQVVQADGDLGKWVAIVEGSGEEDESREVGNVLHSLGDSGVQDVEQRVRAYLDYLDRKRGIAR